MSLILRRIYGCFVCAVFFVCDGCFPSRPFFRHIRSSLLHAICEKDAWMYTETMVNNVRFVRIFAAGACILCILTPILSIIPICIFQLRDENMIGCAGPGVGISVVYVLMILINRRYVLSGFKWLKMFVFPQRRDNQDDLRKHFIRTLRTYYMSERKEDEACSICLQGRRRLTKFCELPCKHVFHRNCILLWIKRQVEPSCPLCRNKDLHAISQFRENPATAIHAVSLNIDENYSGCVQTTDISQKDKGNFETILHL